MFILECTETIQMCYNARKILVIVKEFIKILQWSVPLLLIFLGTWDMFKAVTKGDDQKAVQDATKRFIRRLISGVIVFMVPFLVRLVLGLIESNILSNSNGDVSATSWLGCWNNVENKNSDYFSGCQKSSSSSSSSTSSSSSSTASSSSTNQISCNDYSCPSGATLLGDNRTLQLVTYKNACYCKISIPSSSLYDGSSCSDVKNAGTFAFSERDKNTANDICYFKAKKKGSTSNGTGSGETNTCKECSKGTYNATSKMCVWNTTKPTDLLPEQNNCKYACGNKSVSNSEYESNGIDVCQCMMEPDCSSS